MSINLRGNKTVGLFLLVMAVLSILSAYSGRIDSGSISAGARVKATGLKIASAPSFAGYRVEQVLMDYAKKLNFGIPL